jgi:hypothetical protein
MKNISFLILFIATSINAQIDTAHNFNLSENLTVNYQQIFSAENITANDLKAQLSKQSGLKNIEIKDNQITGQIVDLKITYSKEGPAAPLFLRDHFNADFTIDIKQNKYRLTLTNIVFIDRQSALAYDTDNSEVLKTKIEDLVIKRKKQIFKTSKTIDAALNYTNIYLTKYFSYNAANNDW